MKPPVEHVKVSAKSRDILIKVKRNTGLEHWNEICRIALCQSLANPTPPRSRSKAGDSNIDMEWKTFAGKYKEELIVLFSIRCARDGINTANKEEISEYFRSHIERGIANLKSTSSLKDLI